MVIRILDDETDLDLEIKRCVLQLMEIAKVLEFHNGKIEALEIKIQQILEQISNIETKISDLKL